MDFENFRKEQAAWREESERVCVEFKDKCYAVLDEKYREGMSAYEMKVLQFKTITELFEPKLFEYSPFYYDMGTMAAITDGTAEWHGRVHAGGWTYNKNCHLFIDQDPELWKLRSAQGDELFYLICGPYNDVFQHFDLKYRPILQGGYRSVYERASAALKGATGEKREFLNSVCEAALCVKKISEKFSAAAEKKLETATDQTVRKNLKRIAKSAARTPWEKPQTFYEALNTYAFMRIVFGALEGVGPNTFGRLDLDLYPFYKADIESGRLTRGEAYELIRLFLLTWDCRYDHDMKMVGYSDHELENTFTLGGCDEETGEPVFNELTEAFLRATQQDKTIFPKVKCRFSANSPDGYLDLICKDMLCGHSAYLYQNDDECIPSLLKSGFTLKEARGYLVTGCWGITVDGELYDHGSYINLLKPLEFSIHRMFDKMEKVGMRFTTLDGCRDFEELYSRMLENWRILLRERMRITRSGGRIWNKVDPHPLFSATATDCIGAGRDVTNCGMKYNNDRPVLFGLPNIVDSLLAIKTLCFDKGLYTLDEYLNAVRGNWVGHEDMRMEAVHCRGWGDGSDEAGELANRINHDLYKTACGLEGTYGGKVFLGHLTYTEVRWWGEKTLATPDGRRSGEYFAQGLTPSRLKKINAVSDALYNASQLNRGEMPGNSLINFILPPSRMNAGRARQFMRAIANTPLQSVQLNCFSREQLLDAQKHPEKYPELVVRVTGFSAKFTSLSPEWQQEVITRNFYGQT